MNKILNMIIFEFETNMVDMNYKNDKLQVQIKKFGV